MAWYAALRPTTGKNKGRLLLVAGPYNTNGQAMRAMKPAERIIEQLGFDREDSHWFDWGTAHLKSSRPAAHPAIASRVPTPAGLP